MSGTGTKYDTGKPDLTLLPYSGMEQIAYAFMYGEKKYGRDNYRGGMDVHRLVAAALRHLYAYMTGENNDRESGLSHLGHAGACIFMLIELIAMKRAGDTRYHQAATAIDPQTTGGFDASNTVVYSINADAAEQLRNTR